MFTKTETARRLRVISAEGKRVNGIPTNSKAEVGLRTMQEQMHAATGAEALERMYIDGDDLFDFTDLDGTEKDLQQEGAVVHVYLYTRERPSDIDWDLHSVVVGWLGVKGQEPVLLDVDGTRVAMNLL